MMNMAETLKLGDISKNLKLKNKDIIENLAQYGIELKSSASAITDDVAGFILDLYTAASTMEESEVIELRADAVKAAEKAAKEKAAEIKEEESKEEEEVKKAEESAKPQKDEAEKSAETKSDKPAEKEPKAPEKEEKAEPEKPRREKRKKVAKKQSGQRIDLSNIDRTGADEEFVVKTEEKRRLVDTRQSNVDLKAIESRERIEDMVQGDRRMNNQGGKVKNNKRGGKNRREKEIRKEKKIIPAKVITEILPMGQFTTFTPVT